VYIVVAAHAFAFGLRKNQRLVALAAIPALMLTGKREIRPVVVEGIVCRIQLPAFRTVAQAAIQLQLIAMWRISYLKGNNQYCKT
jgi:hypothetical protein